MKTDKTGLVLWFIAILAVACTVPEEKPRTVIAKVEDEELTYEEIEQDLSPNIRAHLTPMDIKEYVFRWIDNEVLYQEALLRNLDEDEDLQKTLEQIKRELIINNLIQRTLQNQVQVSELEVRAYYDSNQVEFVLPEDMVRCEQIVVPTRKQAEEVRKRLRAGEAFEELAREVSVDSLQRLANGLDSGYVVRDEMIPEIGKVAFSMPVGAYSRPIKTAYGYHIVKVVDKVKAGEPHRFEEVKDQIRLKLEAQKQQENYQRFLLQTKSKFRVTTNFQGLNSVLADSLALGESLK